MVKNRSIFTNGKNSAKALYLNTIYWFLLTLGRAKVRALRHAMRLKLGIEKG